MVTVHHYTDKHTHRHTQHARLSQDGDLGWGRRDQSKQSVLVEETECVYTFACSVITRQHKQL